MSLSQPDRRLLSWCEMSSLQLRVLVGALFFSVMLLASFYSNVFLRSQTPIPPASAHDIAARALREHHAQKALSSHRRPLEGCPRQEGCNAAKRESFDFFSDIVDEDWARMKDRFAETASHHDDNGRAADPHIWYQLNWDPSFTCQHERRVGGTGDGGKWVCDPHRIDPKRCLVYSVGSNNDFSFEESVLREVSESCEIHTFDPTVGTNPSQKPDDVEFHPWGLATDNFQKGGQTFKNMKQIVKDLGHEGRTIDILKIDCEGCEWHTYTGWFGQGVDVRQVQVELHEGTHNAKGRIRPVADYFFTYLQDNGYVIFHKESNSLGSRGRCIEYAFLKLAKEFQIHDATGSV